MSTLSIQLPDSLQDRLADLASREGVSLTDYILYALTRQSQNDAEIRTLSNAEVARQAAEFRGLLDELGDADDDAIAEALSARTPARPERTLAPAVIERLRK